MIASKEYCEVVGRALDNYIGHSEHASENSVCCGNERIESAFIALDINNKINELSTDTQKVLRKDHKPEDFITRY